MRQARRRQRRRPSPALAREAHRAEERRAKEEAHRAEARRAKEEEDRKKEAAELAPWELQTDPQSKLVVYLLSAVQAAQLSRPLVRLSCYAPPAHRHIRRDAAPHA